jgi:hypothetical protein
MVQGPGPGREEVRRNAERGFTSVSFLESPHLLRLSPITNIKHWEPFFKACEETRTVISMHCGASGFVLQGSPGGGLNVRQRRRSVDLRRDPERGPAQELLLLHAG